MHPATRMDRVSGEAGFAARYRAITDGVRSRLRYFSESTNMAWTILLLAGVCEIAWAVGLKYTGHFTQLWPTLGTVAAMIASVLLLEYAVRTLPLGTAYAVWTGIGVIGTVLFGIAVEGEPASLLRMACLLLILIGIIGLRLLPQG